MNGGLAQPRRSGKHRQDEAAALDRLQGEDDAGGRKNA